MKKTETGGKKLRVIHITHEAHERLHKLAFYEGKNLQDAASDAISDKFFGKVPLGKVSREEELEPPRIEESSNAGLPTPGTGVEGRA
jgi:2-hydroxy-3-keto-5-methylthiopentenyl-1-phosphate phosphatase